MDNASNCDTTADHLQRLIPNFRGQASRSRCFPHTVNLIVKAFISFFFRQPKRKKQVKVAQRGRKRDCEHTVTLEPGDENDGLTRLEQELLDEEMTGLNVSPEEDADSSGTSNEVDEAKEAHDREVVKSVHDQAIETARKANVMMSKSQELEALGLFPKVI